MHDTLYACLLLLYQRPHQHIHPHTKRTFDQHEIAWLEMLTHIGRRSRLGRRQRFGILQ